jgi:hypothetical protein
VSLILIYIELRPLIVSSLSQSTSHICETDGYLVKTDKLSGVSRTPTTAVKSSAKAEGLYDVLGGTKLQAACDALEKDGRALMNLGGYTGGCCHSISGP